MAARGLMRCVLAFGLTHSVLAACSATSCSSCASQTVMGFSCRWCPLDSSCHDPESLFNPCSSSENYIYGVNCPEFQISDPSANWSIDRAYSDLFYSYAAYCGETDKGKRLEFSKSKWGQQHPDFELIGQTWKNELFSYVGYDARVDAIKIVFRGTKMHDISNDLADAHVTLSKCSFCGNTKVHTGFYQSFNTLIHAGLGRQIEQAVDQYPGAQVHCTGHSLGGSMAVLAALWTHFLFPTMRVSMYTYGQPRVGLAPFAKYLMRTGMEHFRVVQGKDVIPHMPPTTVGFRHSTVEVWFQGGQISPRFSDMAESQESSSSNSLRVHMSVNDHLNYLGYNEDGCSTPTCICPRGIPSTSQCSGSVNNYEIRCESCFAPYTLQSNGQCS